MKNLAGILLILISLSCNAPVVSGHLKDVKTREILYNYSLRERQKIIRNIRREKFSYPLLLKYLAVKHPTYNKIVLKQFIHETGRFSSKIFLKNNNICGMKHPYKRKTLSLGTKRGHAYYASVWDSVDDYFLWTDFYIRQRVLKPNCSYDEYYKFLKRVGYAEDRRYIEKLKHLKLS